VFADDRLDLKAEASLHKFMSQLTAMPHVLSFEIVVDNPKSCSPLGTKHQRISSHDDAMRKPAPSTRNCSRKSRFENPKRLRFIASLSQERCAVNKCENLKGQYDRFNDVHCSRFVFPTTADSKSECCFGMPPSQGAGQQGDHETVGQKRQDAALSATLFATAALTVSGVPRMTSKIESVTVQTCLWGNTEMTQHERGAVLHKEECDNESFSFHDSNCPDTTAAAATVCSKVRHAIGQACT
jgi:hypothetical protein